MCSSCVFLSMVVDEEFMAPVKQSSRLLLYPRAAHPASQPGQGVFRKMPGARAPVPRAAENGPLTASESTAAGCPEREPRSRVAACERSAPGLSAETLRAQRVPANSFRPVIHGRAATDRAGRPNSVTRYPAPYVEQQLHFFQEGFATWSPRAFFFIFI